MTGWSRMSDDEGRVSIACPPDWTAAEAEADVALAAVAPAEDAEAFRPNVNVVVEEAGDAPLEEHVAAAVAGIERVLTDLRVLDYEEVELDGLPARKILAAYRFGVHSPTLLQRYAIKEGRLVTVSATAATESFNADREVLETMAESVTIA